MYEAGGSGGRGEDDNWLSNKGQMMGDVICQCLRQANKIYYRQSHYKLGAKLL